MPNKSLLIATYRGQPVRFVRTHQSAWSICAVDEATHFIDAEDAAIALRQWGLDAAQFEIIPEPASALPV